MQNNPLATPIARRTVITAAAATGLLAACGGTDSGTATGATSSAAAPDATGEVLASAADVPLDGGIINKDGKYVVTQPAEGEYRAFSSVCPHQQCQVGQVKDNAILCPCHGSVFNADTGDVEQGPAQTGLAPIAVTVDGGNVIRA